MLISHCSVIVALPIDELQHCTLGFVTDLLGHVAEDGIGSGILADRLSQCRQLLLVYFRSKSRVHCIVHLVIDEYVRERHVVPGQRSSFVRAYVVHAAHSFAGLEVSNQIVLVFHLAHAVGQCDCDSEG